MYIPKRSLDDGFEDTNESFPKRALSDQKQTFIDTMIAINGLSPDKDFGYFVSFDRYGGPCPNRVYGVNYPTKV